jgi:3-dehydroquinate synthase
VAIGGGTIIDLAGMISSMIYRGINFISIPTTLLASADAAISCKNALNLSGAKNLIGTYALPKKIFIETEYVYSFLDSRYFWDGFAEIIKHAIGHSRKLYNHLVNDNSAYIKKKYINKLNQKEKEEFLRDISEILLMTIQSKTELFNEKNNELQPLYHFGHTIGHALEIATKHKCFHGEAISIGMIVATELSISRNKLNRRIMKDLLFLIEKFNLPKVINKKIFNQKLFNSAIKKDKRYFDGNNHFILMDKKFKISSKLTPIKYDEFYNILKKYIC